MTAATSPSSWLARARTSTTTVAALIVLCAIAGCGGSEPAADTAPATVEATVEASVPTAPPSAAVDTLASTTLATSSLPTSTNATTSSTAPTTVAETAAPTSAAPTTVADTRPVDETAQALALAGTLVATDFPEPWTQYSEGGELTVDPNGCSYQPDGPTTKVPRGGGQFGPTMQFGDTGAFVSSSTLVFPDESTASEFIAIVNTDEWGTCRAGQLQQYQRDNGGDDISVQVTSRTTDTLGQSGFEAYGEFSLTDAAGDVTRVVLISYYRLGPTVIIVNQEYGALEDAQSTAFFDDAYNALDAAYQRVNALQ